MQASNVVGIWITLIPLIYVAATNPARSPTTPPPRAIITSSRDIFASATKLIMAV